MVAENNSSCQKSVQDIISITLPKIIYHAESKLKKTHPHSTANHIIFAPSLESLEVTLNWLENTTIWNVRTKFLIVLCNQETNELERYFLTLWKHDIYNVALTTGELEHFFTWDPYSEQSDCGRNVKVEEKKFSNAWKGKLLRQQHNCSLHVTWTHYLWYSRNPDNKTYPGYLFYLLFTYAEKTNASIKLYRDDEFLATYIDNKPYTEHLKQMKINHTDIALLPHPLTVNFESYLKISSVIKQVDTVCLLPQRKKLMSWDKIITVLPKSTWIAILILITVLVCVWVLFFRAQGMSYPTALGESVFITYSLFINAATTMKPQFGHVRILLLFCLIHHLHLICFYMASLSSTLTWPRYEPRIDTLEQLLAADVTLKTVGRTDHTIRRMKGEKVRMNILEAN